MVGSVFMLNNADIFKTREVSKEDAINFEPVQELKRLEKQYASSSGFVSSLLEYVANLHS